MRIFTIGHSTHTLEELVEALKSFGVRTLVDIRTVPRSRRVPHFNKGSLAQTLPRLPPPEGAGRAQETPSQFRQHRLAEPGLPGVRGLPRDRGVQGGPGRAPDPGAKGRTGGHYVRRGGPLALPPVFGRRRAHGPRGYRPPHHGSREGEPPHPHTLGPRRGTACLVPGTFPGGRTGPGASPLTPGGSTRPQPAATP